MTVEKIPMGTRTKVAMMLYCDRCPKQELPVQLKETDSKNDESYYDEWSQVHWPKFYKKGWRMANLYAGLAYADNVFVYLCPDCVKHKKLGDIITLTKEEEKRCSFVPKKYGDALLKKLLEEEESKS